MRYLSGGDTHPKYCVSHLLCGAHRPQESDQSPSDEHPGNYLSEQELRKLEGEVRTWEDPESMRYQTDGMIFSDTGIPVILFMEDYDIEGSRYHDTHDTMEDIDLDYGAAVSAIAIETLTRLAAF